MASPYRIQSEAPMPCTNRNLAPWVQRYDDTNTSVAVHPRYSSMISLGSRRRLRLRRRHVDDHAIGPCLLPVSERQAMRLEEAPDLRRPPAEKLIKDRHQNAERVVAEHGALRDP